jgi:hypothetical protein
MIDYKSTLKMMRNFFAFKYKHEVILGFFLTFTGVSFLINWMLQYRSVDGNIHLSYRLSSQSQVDIPWLPPGKNSQPIFGVHHFGDWQMMSAYSQISNPFAGEYPAITPPFGLIITRLLNSFGVQFGYLLFTILCLTLYWILITSRLTTAKTLEKILVFCFITVFSLPFMFAFDRGSAVSVAIVSIALGLNYSHKNKKIKSIIFFCFGISIKPYLLFFFLLLLAKKSYREFLINIGVVITINVLVLMTFYSDNLIVGLSDYIKSILFFSNQIEPLNQLKSVSPLSFTSKIVEIIDGREAALLFYEKFMPFYFIITIIIFILGWLIAKNSKMSFETKILIYLSLIPCLIPNSMFYTLTWSSCAFVYWIQILAKEEKEFQISRFQNLSLLMLFMVVLSPNLAVVNLHNPSGLYFLQHFLYFPSLVLVLASFAKHPAFLNKQKKDLHKPV